MGLARLIHDAEHLPAHACPEPGLRVGLFHSLLGVRRQKSAAELLILRLRHDGRVVYGRNDVQARRQVPEDLREIGAVPGEDFHVSKIAPSVSGVAPGEWPAVTLLGEWLGPRADRAHLRR